VSRAIVIGAGFGGLAAALRLRRRGYEVTVVEAGAQPGGRARVFHQDGFTFDAGPTVITAPYLFDELFELFGRRRQDAVEFLPVDPLYRVTFPDGEHFDYAQGDEPLHEEIRRLSPGDVDGYRRLARHAERIFAVGYEKLADQPFGRVTDMLRIVPDLARLSAHRSVYSLVSSYVKDERLRQVLSFEPLLIGGNPLRVPGIYLLVHWLERNGGCISPRAGPSLSSRRSCAWRSRSEWKCICALRSNGSWSRAGKRGASSSNRGRHCEPTWSSATATRPWFTPR